MAASSSSIHERRRNDVVLPLVVCSRCNCRTVKAYMAKTLLNNGRYFYICPTYKRAGGGCDFWYWEEDYEDFFIENGHVPANYQRLFKKDEPMQMTTLAVDGRRTGQETDGRIVHQMNLGLGLLRELVLLVKILVLAVTCILVINLYGLVMK
ncbi:hypothetical protein BS78_07G083800 [Paspalum vaginatum]|nr:hypothetical protein BS78_07G083800 [Paspalum vaginatum]